MNWHELQINKTQGIKGIQEKKKLNKTKKNDLSTTKKNAVVYIFILHAVI